MNTPKIRFKGFTDDWEQRKLGEVAEYRNGKAHENEIDKEEEKWTLLLIQILNN